MEGEYHNHKQPRFRKLSRKRPKLTKEAYSQDVKKEDLNGECTDIYYESKEVEYDKKSNPSPPLFKCQPYEAALCPLPNIGSTCFFNSVIQVLRFTPGFLNCLHQMTYVVSLESCTSKYSLLKFIIQIFRTLCGKMAKFP